MLQEAEAPGASCKEVALVADTVAPKKTYPVPVPVYWTKQPFLVPDEAKALWKVLPVVMVTAAAVVVPVAKAVVIGVIEEMPWTVTTLEEALPAVPGEEPATVVVS